MLKISKLLVLACSISRPFGGAAEATGIDAGVFRNAGAGCSRRSSVSAPSAAGS